MPTGYPGRETDYDLGRGHSLTWPGGGLLTERHGYGPHGGWHGFDIALAGMLTTGGPGDEQHLALAVPVQCPLCGTTGRITSGRWEPD